MPRPRKSRKVCHFPRCHSFGPTEQIPAKEPVILTVDEYEAVRLIDQEGFSQESCGVRMGIARTTVQQIYATARKKLAQMLVEGIPLKIAGGDYQLCSGRQECGETMCFKQYYSKEYEKPEPCVRIAAAYDAGKICLNFEDARQFKIYDVRKKNLLASRVVDIQAADRNQLACILTALRTNILICGYISAGIGLALDAAGIRVHGDISGDADSEAALFFGE